MKSTDLVNWHMASYAYETLADNEALRLENGKNAYGAGSWASSLRYHDGVFHASTFSATSGRTHVYTTRDPDRGPWKETSFEPVMHDHSLFFDDDGRVYMVYGGGRIMLTELKPDLSGIKPGGVNKVLIENVNTLFGADLGTHQLGFLHFGLLGLLQLRFQLRDLAILNLGDLLPIALALGFLHLQADFLDLFLDMLRTVHGGLLARRQARHHDQPPVARQHPVRAQEEDRQEKGEARHQGTTGFEGLAPESCTRGPRAEGTSKPKP